MALKNSIVIQEYSDEWPIMFAELKEVYKNNLPNLYLGIEHVGSTAVAGLSAKPVIDIDIIAPDADTVQHLIPIIESLGYVHLGDLGISRREAFKRVHSGAPIDGSNRVWQQHNLYLCLAHSVSLQNHILLRNYLRANAKAALQYGNLKKQLAAQYPYDIDKYVEGKTAFITHILKQLGIVADEIDKITEQNKSK